MRAAVLHGYRQAPVVGEHPDPVTAPGHTLVEVTAAPIVPLDLLCATGASYFGEQPLPYVPGCQGVGRTPDGRRVWFTTTAGQQPGDGSFAQRCSVPDEQLMTLTQDVPDGLVAALGLSAVAALGALRRGGLTDGEHVVVTGANGVVGQVATQLARLLGAGRVVAVARPGQLGTLDGLGADEVVPVTEDRQQLTDRIARAARGRVDLVVDPVWGLPGAAAFAALSWGGRHVNLGDSAGPAGEVTSVALRSRSVDLRGYTNLSLDAAQQRAALGQVLDAVGSGRLRLAYDEDRLAAAGRRWAQVADGSAPRRIVLVP